MRPIIITEDDPMIRVVESFVNRDQASVISARSYSSAESLARSVAAEYPNPVILVIREADEDRRQFLANLEPRIKVAYGPVDLLRYLGRGK